MIKAQRALMQGAIDRLVPFVGDIEEVLEGIVRLHMQEKIKVGNIGAQGGTMARRLKADVEELDVAETELGAARDALDNAINALVGIVERK